MKTLNVHIVEFWDEMESSYFIKICKSFCQHVEADIAANSGYIKWEGHGCMWLIVANHCFIFVFNIYSQVSIVCKNTEKGQNFLRTPYRMPNFHQDSPYSAQPTLSPYSARIRAATFILGQHSSSTFNIHHHSHSTFIQHSVAIWKLHTTCNSVPVIRT